MTTAVADQIMRSAPPTKTQTLSTENSQKEDITVLDKGHAFLIEVISLKRIVIYLINDDGADDQNHLSFLGLLL